MSYRVIVWSGAAALLVMLAGLLVVDQPLAVWIHTSGIEDAAIFRVGLAGLDNFAGIHVSYWLAAVVLAIVGAICLIIDRQSRVAKMLLAAAAVNAATIGTMMLGKNLFGRLRPSQVLESGDWAHTWFVGGGSFPSGHASFYFGLFLPLAAACRPLWLRALLLAVPVYVSLARMDLARHFLSDVAASAVMAAIFTLIVAWVFHHSSNAPGRDET